MGRHEKRESDNGHDSVKNQKRKKRALVCHSCGGMGHPARLCPTPSDHAAHAVDEEGDTEEESSDEGDVCGVEWECELNGTGDEDDDVLGMGCESAEQSKWERLAAVVDSGAAENVLPAGVCNHVQPPFLQEALAESESDGHVAGAGGRHEETAHVSGQDGRSREPCSPRQQGSQDGQTEERYHSSAEGRERVRRRSLGQERCNQQDAEFSPAGLSPEVCPTDDGQTIRPVRDEGAARERNVVGFDLGGVEDAQEECKVGPHAEEEPNMDCESDGGEDGERVRLLPKPRTPSKAEWERHVVSHMPLRDWCRHCVAGRGLERRHQRHPGHDDRCPLVCSDHGYLSGDATPMLVAKVRRTGMVLALPVERKGAADPHAVEQLAAWVDLLGSSQMAIRSDGEPAVMQVADAVRDAGRAGSVTTLETSAAGDHAGNGLAERAVGLVGGMVRKLKNELEFNCQMQIPRESKTIAWMIVHATTLLNLDTGGSDGKVPFERW